MEIIILNNKFCLLETKNKGIVHNKYDEYRNSQIIEIPNRIQKPDGIILNVK